MATTFKIRLSIPLHSTEQEDGLPVKTDWAIKNVMFKIPPFKGMEYEDPDTMYTAVITRVVERQNDTLVTCSPRTVPLADFATLKQDYLDHGWSENL